MEKLTFLCYDRCSTCKKARAFLQGAGVPFRERDIKGEHPGAQELARWIGLSGLEVRRFFNTSGQLYREQGLSGRLGAMTREEQIALLASDGMLVKRPLLIGPDWVLVGFREEQWRQRLQEGVPH